MATIAANITGLDVSDTVQYYYLYEPFKINITESTDGATKIYCNLVVYNTEDSSDAIDSQSQYGNWDFNGDSLNVDVMKIIRQYHDSNVFKIGTIADLEKDNDFCIVSKYRYEVRFYSDVNSGVQTINILPIIGGRDFYNYSTSVDDTSPTNEAELYGFNLNGRWLNYPNIEVVMESADEDDAKPSVSVTNETSAELEPCGGMLIWKSRLGGWMYWGMDIATITHNSKYIGNLAVDMFEANSSGNPYVEMNYTDIETSFSANLKALSLTSDELKAVSYIAHSPAVYYMKDNDEWTDSTTSRLELVRVKSSSAPISSLSNGGDFSVSIESISSQSQKTR